MRQAKTIHLELTEKEYEHVFNAMRAYYYQCPPFAANHRDVLYALEMKLERQRNKSLYPFLPENRGTEK